MGLLGDSIALYKREAMVFRANLRTNIIRTALFPIVILTFFSFLGAAITNVPVAVVNLANNQQSTQFISTLSAEELMNVQSVTTQAQAMSLLAAGQVNFVIVVLPTFPSRSGASVEVYYNNVEYSTTEEVLPAIQRDVALFGPDSNFQSEQYLPSGSSQTPSIETPVSGASGSYDDFLFSGVIGMIIVFSALFSAGIGTLLDKQGGQIKAFLITPINKSSIVIGRTMFSAVQAIFSVLIVIAIGLALGNTIIMGFVGVLWIILLAMLLAVCMTGISIIMASRMRNMQAFQIFAQTFALPMWFISGGIFPVSSFPPVLQALSVIDPMTYALNGFRFVVLEGIFPLASIIIDVGVLVFFAALFTVIAIVMFKRTID